MMQNLKDILIEGILDDIETTLKDMDKGAYAKMYPVPDKSKFYITHSHWKAAYCDWGIDWSCKDYINQFLDAHPDVKKYHEYEIEGLCGRIIYVDDNKYSVSIETYTLIHGTRQWVSNFNFRTETEKYSQGKSLILRMFKHLLKYPNAMQYLIDWSAEHRGSYGGASVEHELTFDEVFKIKK